MRRGLLVELEEGAVVVVCSTGASSVVLVVVVVVVRATVSDGDTAFDGTGGSAEGSLDSGACDMVRMSLRVDVTEIAV
jgi:hypothetical protein